MAGTHIERARYDAYALYFAFLMILVLIGCNPPKGEAHQGERSSAQQLEAEAPSDTQGIILGNNEHIVIPFPNGRSLVLNNTRADGVEEFVVVNPFNPPEEVQATSEQVVFIPLAPGAEIIVWSLEEFSAHVLIPDTETGTGDKVIAVPVEPTQEGYTAGIEFNQDEETGANGFLVLTPQGDQSFNLETLPPPLQDA